MAYTRPSIRKDLNKLESMIQGLKDGTEGTALGKLEEICSLTESMEEKLTEGIDTLNNMDRMTEAQEERMTMLENVHTVIDNLKSKYEDMKEAFDNMEDDVTAITDLDDEL